MEPETIQVALPRGIVVHSATDQAARLVGPVPALRLLASELQRYLPSVQPRVSDTGPQEGMRPGAVHGDDSVVWSMHSGGERHTQPPWTNPSDLSLALDALRIFSPKARALLSELVARPGELVAAEELVVVLGVPNPYGVAGVMGGFVRGCEAAVRAFPVHWWERSVGAALYAVRPSVAELFSEAFAHLDVQPIRARRDDRWYSQVIPAAITILAERARQAALIRYRELATEINSAVPGARIPYRGPALGWLLADITQAVHAVDPEAPLLTSVVVGADGRPASGLAAMAEELGRGVPDAASEQQLCASTYTDAYVARLLDRIAEQR